MNELRELREWIVNEIYPMYEEVKRQRNDRVLVTTAVTEDNKIYKAAMSVGVGIVEKIDDMLGGSHDGE